MFRTELTPQQSDKKITYKDPIMTIGSCFSESIGSRFELNKFNVLPNPFGVIFNPLAQFKLLSFALGKKYPDDYTYILNQSIWYNYDLHSDFSAISQDELKLKIEGSIDQTHEFLKTAGWLFITFGTSIGYYLKTNSQMVANCHKVPAAEFEKKLVSQKQILNSFKELHSRLQDFNRNLQIILTVSPVRHLKETLELNSVSKSILRIAADSIQTEYPNVSYFPAYEILLDDLRDYRFYAKDMVHPNETGEEYIWQKFIGSYLDDSATSTLQEWENVRKSLEHKPFHRESEAYKKFLESTLKQLHLLENRINVTREIDQIERQLH